MNHVEVRGELESDRRTREAKRELGIIALKYIVTLMFISTIFIPQIFTGSLFFMIISGALSIYAWGKDLYGLIRRKKKYGRNWKWYKDRLIKEFIIVVIIAIIGILLIKSFF